MQGVFNNGSRFKTKKAFREAVEGVNLWEEHGGDPEAIGHLEQLYLVRSPEARKADKVVMPKDPYSVVIEATSVFGNEFDGSLANAPKPIKYSIVGPDPHTSRKWYATLSYDKDKHEWVVK